MAQIGLVDRIHAAAAAIDAGRKGFATRGKEHEGRLSYEEGIAEALSAFKEAATTADPHIMSLAEYTFLTQEFELCDKADKDTRSSLTQALQSYDDAFLALKAVIDKTMYQGVELAIPHSKKYRVGGGYPKDAFHIACIAHKTRLQNILRSPGIDPLEKELLKQRLANLPIAQKAYIEKQKKTLFG